MRLQWVCPGAAPLWGCSQPAQLSEAPGGGSCLEAPVNASPGFSSKRGSPEEQREARGVQQTPERNASLQLVGAVVSSASGVNGSQHPRPDPLHCGCPGAEAERGPDSAQSTPRTLSPCVRHCRIFTSLLGQNQRGGKHVSNRKCDSEMDEALPGCASLPS